MSAPVGIERQSFVRRAVIPAGIVMGASAFAYAAYFSSSLLWPPAFHRPFAFVMGLVLFILIGFGPLIAYPLAYFRGASIAERMGASLATIIAWIAVELSLVSEFFTLGETLYYGLSSAFAITVISAFALMGICEMICRKVRARRTGEMVRIVTPAPVIAIMAGIVAVLVMLVWGIGEHWFYIYIEGYRLIFH
ncbi:MAG: hypothetical protein EPN93_19635 [Spirochaetes bacterium]|nr:MAG: hypothetical protein EPN93_19635 [Spirochaetota bacterium]